VICEGKADAWLVISSVDRDRNHAWLACDRQWIGCGWGSKRMANTELKNFFDIVHYFAQNPYLELQEAKSMPDESNR
jgi:hypothetical protein